MSEETLPKTVSEKIDSYWSEKAIRKGPSRTRWGEFPTIIRHINQLVCGKPVDGSSMGIRLELKKLGRSFEHGVSVGCGEGTKEFELMTEGIVKRFAMFELSTERIKRARERAESLGLLGRVELIHGDCFLHDFKEKVDFVHWNSSLHHMLDTEKAVKWSFDILSPGGVFFMDDFVGPTRFQWSTEALKLGTRVRRVLPEGFLKNPYKEGSYISRELSRPDAQELADSDPSEAADSSNIIKSVKKYFPNAEIKLTGGLIYHATLNDILHNIDESDEKDKAILELLLIIDELSLNSRVESQYAAALAVKPGLDVRSAHTSIAGTGAPSSARRTPTLLSCGSAERLARMTKAVLRYSTRFVPLPIKTIMPLRFRQTVNRLLRES